MSLDQQYQAVCDKFEKRIDSQFKISVAEGAGEEVVKQAIAGAAREVGGAFNDFAQEIENIQIPAEDSSPNRGGKKSNESRWTEFKKMVDKCRSAILNGFRHLARMIAQGVKYAWKQVNKFFRWARGKVNALFSSLEHPHVV